MSKLIAIVGLLATLLFSTNTTAAIASYYGLKFHNRLTASGERFNMYALTCASNTHKIGTKLKVTNKSNGKSVICKVNDTGGFKKYGRVLDMSYGSFVKIANQKVGLIKVTINKL